MTARDRFECFMRAHDVYVSIATLGVMTHRCYRCQHVLDAEGRILWHGEPVDYPPKHRDGEQSGERMHR